MTPSAPRPAAGELLSNRLPVPPSPTAPDGWTSVADLVPGAQLYAADGTVTHVLNLTPPQETPTLVVELSNGRGVRVAAGQLWKVTAEDRNPRLSHDLVTISRNLRFATSRLEPGAYADATELADLAAAAVAPATAGDFDLIAATAGVRDHLGLRVEDRWLYPAAEMLALAAEFVQGRESRIVSTTELMEPQAPRLLASVANVPDRTDQPFRGRVRVTAVTEAPPALTRAVSVAHPEGLYLTGQFLPVHDVRAVASSRPEAMTSACGGS